ncbi:hypothetical protein SAMN04489727_2647 [Amycolatopsis tolypomycina]|uniref:Uncharacterized protein n=2 Tax=Amycolatopsis tolypomycina TaxID=208445 RepID=A0A1H4PY55_9PSEU|nr:hypothetical protein SAMN04489727_2647 [Amycolatopsis tolypomycina]
MQRIRQDAAAARVLAGTADRDVSEFKQILNGHTKVLNAMRETQVEQGQRLDLLESKFDQLDAKVDRGFTKVNIGIEQMSRLLQQVIDKD